MGSSMLWIRKMRKFVLRRLKIPKRELDWATQAQKRMEASKRRAMENIGDTPRVPRFMEVWGHGVDEIKYVTEVMKDVQESLEVDIVASRIRFAATLIAASVSLVLSSLRVPIAPEIVTVIAALTAGVGVRSLDLRQGNKIRLLEKCAEVVRGLEKPFDSVVILGSISDDEFSDFIRRVNAARERSVSEMRELLGERMRINAHAQLESITDYAEHSRTDASRSLRGSE